MALSFNKKSFCFIILSFVLFLPSINLPALDDGLARTPPMGWNSWNTFGTNVDENLMVADTNLKTQGHLCFLGG
jgi:alpha-galactosidase